MSLPCDYIYKGKKYSEKEYLALRQKELTELASVYNKGIELIQGSRYLEKVTKSDFYKEEAAKLPENQRARYFEHEALATAVGDKGAQFVTEARKKGFKEWLENLWNVIKNTIGFKDITAEELSNLTLDEFSKRAAADILREQKQQQAQAEEQIEEEEDEDQQQWEQRDAISEYGMTTSGKVNDMLSGKTITETMGYAPEGSQEYNHQALSDMLMDGKNMIGAAMSMFGSSDVGEYGPQLFDYIKKMSADEALFAKKAVLMGTFLGEIKEEINRNPDRADELRRLDNAMTSYYQDYMNNRGKEISSVRILRLYRDKYMGDMFAEQILEEQELRDQREIRNLQQKEMDIEAAVAAGIEDYKATTQAEKDAADAEAAEKDIANAKLKQKKKPMSPTEMNRIAKEKEKQMAAKGSMKAVVDRIKEMIKKCK